MMNTDNIKTAAKTAALETQVPTGTKDKDTAVASGVADDKDSDAVISPVKEKVGLPLGVTVPASGR